MFDAEGQISIPMEEFWIFVQKYHSLNNAEIAYGILRVEEGHLVIDYAASSECNPNDWVVKTKAVLQWEQLKKQEVG